MKDNTPSPFTNTHYSYSKKPDNIPIEQLHKIPEEYSYEKVAKNIISGQFLENVYIEDLSILIDTIVELMQENTKSDASAYEYYPLIIYGGYIKRFKSNAKPDYKKTIPIFLKISATFLLADFSCFNFTESVWLNNSFFLEHTNFDYADFQKDATFEHSTFKRPANFINANFKSTSNFSNITFLENANFENTTFEDNVMFIEGECNEISFAGCKINEMSCFALAKLNGYTTFHRSTIAGELNLRSYINPVSTSINLTSIKLKQSGSITIYKQQLKNYYRPIEKTPWQTNIDIFSYLITKIPNNPYLFLIKRPLEYIDIILSFRFNIYYLFNIGITGSLIYGEDTDLNFPFINSKKLKPTNKINDYDDDNEYQLLTNAASQYNLLRNNFRNQPSTESEEDICHFKYKDLTRRAKWYDPEIKWYHPTLLFLEWLLFRNALGYLIKPLSVLCTGIFIITFFAFIYAYNWPSIAQPETQTILEQFSNYITNTPTPEPVPTNWYQPIYFSIITFSTIGYGELHPNTPWMQFFTSLQGLLGILWASLFIITVSRKMIR